MVVWEGLEMLHPLGVRVDYDGAPYVFALTNEIKANTNGRTVRQDPVIAGPFPTLDAAKAAFLVIYGGGDG